MGLLSHDELVRLTPPKRLTLISQLWDSLEDEPLPLTAVQRAELDSRFATLDEDRREGISWADLKAELERRCPWCIRRFDRSDRNQTQDNAELTDR